VQELGVHPRDSVDGADYARGPRAQSGASHLADIGSDSDTRCVLAPATRQGASEEKSLKRQLDHGSSQFPVLLLEKAQQAYGFAVRAFPGGRIGFSRPVPFELQFVQRR
jgi:hypothetical protein